MNRGGEFNPPEQAMIHNSEVNVLLDMHAKLLEAFVLRRQRIKSWGSDMEKRVIPVCCVIVFLQINIKKNTNSSLKRPQDKSTKTGSVKKEKVVKKEEGNYVITFHQ